MTEHIWSVAVCVVLTLACLLFARYAGKRAKAIQDKLDRDRQKKIEQQERRLRDLEARERALRDHLNRAQVPVDPVRDFLREIEPTRRQQSTTTVRTNLSPQDTERLLRDAVTRPLQQVQEHLREALRTQGGQMFQQHPEAFEWHTTRVEVTERRSPAEPAPQARPPEPPKPKTAAPEPAAKRRDRFDRILKDDE